MRAVLNWRHVVAVYEYQTGSDIETRVKMSNGSLYKVTSPSTFEEAVVLIAQPIATNFAHGNHLDVVRLPQ